MKALKKLSQNQLIGALTFVFVVLLGIGLYLANSPGEVVDDFDSNETPPLVRIDAGYNATLSGQPFYRVDDSDEDFDDSLDVCNEFGSDSYRRGVQNGWYQVVAYEDNMRVEDVIFEQIDLEEGDLMVAVLYDSEEQEWKAWPNKIILDEDGDRVELLDRDMRLKKGTVVSVSSNQNVDYCFDYEEVGSHENIDLRWNLVSRPDFEEVDYRSIWEVAFAKSGDSRVDLERYYSSSDPDDSVDVADLEADQLYWVYGGKPSVVSGGGDLPEEELVCDTYEIRVTADYSNYTPSDSSQENLETNVANSLDEQPWLYATYDDVDDFNENLERLKNEGAVVEGKCTEEEVACTDIVRPGIKLSVRAEDGSLIKNATVLVTTNGNEADRQVNSDNSGNGTIYTLLDTKDMAGSFNVSVVADGYISKDIDLVIEEDDCNNVVTLEREIVLAPESNEQENKVSVSVIDSETRTPLSGVNVFVESSQIASNSDFNGELELSGFNDNANLIARFTGYRDERVSVSQAVDGKLVIAMNPVNSCVTTFEGSPGFGDFVGSVALGESEEFGAAAFASIDISNCDFVSDNKEGFFIKTNEMPQAISGMVGNSQVRNVLTYSEDGPGLYSLLWFNYDGLTTNASTINIRLTQTNGDEIEFTLPLKEFSSDSIDITAGATEIGNGQASVALTESENIVLVLEKPGTGENANVVVQDQYVPSSLAMDYNISIVNDKVVMIINSAEAGEYTVEVQYARSDSQTDLMNNTSNGIYKFEVVE